MARLEASSEWELDTDYAILAATHARVADLPLSGTYAASAPGSVAMMCGTAYASLQVRLERWSALPPSVDRDWEDCDELPWVSLPGADPVLVQGFDGADRSDGLTMDGLTRGRVQVLATGRHRYSYGDHAEGLPPERWLLRWWPDDAEVDPLTGPPRRIPEPRSDPYRGTAWAAAVHSWRQAGWQSALGSVRAFHHIEDALNRAGGPCSREELAALWRPRDSLEARGGPYDWDSSILGHDAADHPEWPTAHQQELLQQVAQAAGIPPLGTFRDALDALIRLGLVTRCDGPVPDLLAPNPAPRRVGDILDLNPVMNKICLTDALADYRDLEGDITHLINWSPRSGLTTSPQRIAVRLSLTVDDVLGCLQLLTHSAKITVIADEDPITADTVITLAKRVTDQA